HDDQRFRAGCLAEPPYPTADADPPRAYERRRDAWLVERSDWSKTALSIQPAHLCAGESPSAGNDGFIADHSEQLRWKRGVATEADSLIGVLMRSSSSA